MIGLDVRRAPHNLYAGCCNAGLPYDPSSRRVLRVWGACGVGDRNGCRCRLEAHMTDWAAITRDAFMQGLVFILALAFGAAIIAVTVAGLIGVWKRITS